MVQPAFKLLSTSLTRISVNYLFGSQMANHRYINVSFWKIKYWLSILYMKKVLKSENLYPIVARAYHSLSITVSTATPEKLNNSAPWEEWKHICVVHYADISTFLALRRIQGDTGWPRENHQQLLCEQTKKEKIDVSDCSPSSEWMTIRGLQSHTSVFYYSFSIHYGV